MVTCDCPVCRWLGAVSLVILAALFVVGCGGQGDSADGGAASALLPSVSIVSPADGAIVDGGTVVVQLGVANLAIVPAGDQTPNSGHHHLFLDRDVTPAGEVIPQEPGHVVHMGDASATYTFQNVTPGEHRLIAVVADHVHIPLQPWVVDTIRFTVR